MVDDSRLVCKFCGLSFARPTSLAAHMDAHHVAPRLYCCTECDYTTTHVSHFKTHIQSHSDPSSILTTALESIPNYCSLCGKYFRQNHSLTEHMALVHTNTLPYSCDVCGAEFRTLSSHAQHMKRHSSPHICPDCGESFPLPAALRAHVRTAHRAAHVCDVCGASFTRKSNLDEHCAKHSAPAADRRTFLCPVEGCSSAFTRKSNLQTHLQTVHGGLQAHTCEICGKDFRYPSLLARHKASHHERIVPEVVELGENWMEGGL